MTIRPLLFFRQTERDRTRYGISAGSIRATVTSNVPVAEESTHKPTHVQMDSHRSQIPTSLYGGVRMGGTVLKSRNERNEALEEQDEEGDESNEGI